MPSKTPRWSLVELFKPKRKPPAPVKVRLANTFHAVSIVPGPSACGAAHRFAGRRILSRHAPPLPLPTCDAPHCDCKFKHHKDRRAGARRRSDIGLSSGMFSGEERRQARGRRSTDAK